MVDISDSTEQSHSGVLQEFWKDLRYGLRLLLKTPGFTALAVISLALGIGANTAMFTVVDSVLIRPLSYPHADRLMDISAEPGSWLNYRDIRDQVSAFENVGAYATDFAIIHTPQGAQTVFAPKLSANLLEVLGVQPGFGRGFRPTDTEAGAPLTALLGYGLWRKEFAGERSVIGQQVSNGKVSYTIIGVMPQGFGFPGPSVASEAIIWQPLQPTADMQKDRGSSFLSMIGRLKANASPAMAQAQLAAVAQRIRLVDPQHSTNLQFDLRPYRDVVTASVRPVLFALTAALALVLLIACANVASMLLARYLARQHELAMRMALGARRARLLRQLMTEGALLGVMGGAAGFAIAWLIVRSVRSLPEGLIPRGEEIHLRWEVVAALALFAAVCAVLSSIAPGLSASRTDPQVLLRGAGRGVAGSGSRLNNWLLAGEVTLATVLLIASGLIFHTLYNLQHVNLGFQPQQVLTFTATPPESAGFFGYDSSTVSKAAPSIAVTTYPMLLERLRRLPGVSEAAMVSVRPLQHIDMVTQFKIVGRPEDKNRMQARIRTVSGGYAQTMGTPVLRGRAISELDTATAPPVVVVNKTFAREFFGNEDPIGHQIDLDDKALQPYTIVGVVADTVQDRLSDTPKPEINLSSEQVPPTSFYYSILVQSISNFVVKARNQADLSQSVRAVFREAAPGFALDDFEVLTHSVDQASFNHRLGLYLIGSFAALAVLMVLVGLYGVLAQLVAQRHREFGVRVALGATRQSILLLVIRRGAVLISGGLAVGLVAAYLTSNVVRSFLFGISALDVWTYVAVVLCLVIVGLIASAIPAQRAAGVSPVEALRAE